MAAKRKLASEPSVEMKRCDMPTTKGDIDVISKIIGKDG
jgi:hypothetical protein